MLTKHEKYYILTVVNSKLGYACVKDTINNKKLSLTMITNKEITTLTIINEIRKEEIL